MTTIGRETAGPEWLRKFIGVDRMKEANVVERICRVQVWNTEFSDADVAYLSGLKNLRKLSLPGTAISDTGLRHLMGLTTLETLDIRETMVTDKSIEELRNALPACDIIH
jgi:hypothetical protein